MEQRKYISILGDDRSTFEGVTPKIGSFYSPSYVSYAGFATPEGTWWMQLIHRLGGQLLVNNSFAGSHISCAGNYAACLPGRIRSLATEAAAEQTPAMPFDVCDAIVPDAVFQVHARRSTQK